MKSQCVVTLVHGTWARKTQWIRPRSALSTALRDIDAVDVKLFRFVWSGRNSPAAPHAVDRIRDAPLAHSKVMTVQLPFTREQFFDVFAAYNASLWPGVLALWIASVVVAVLLLGRSRLASDRVVGTLLAIHWAWSALAYHIAFFTSINPAAWLFGALFLVEAALLWRGTMRGTLRFAAWPSAWAPIAWVLIAYSLVYPAINAAQHGSFSRIPIFGVPCPTTIFTAGLLMLAAPPSWVLAIVPIVWSAIGGSAASLLGVRADYALPVAGLALALSLISRRAVFGSSASGREPTPNRLPPR